MNFKVNKYQKMVMIAAATAILLMGLCPPFYVHIKGVTFNLGYTYIMEPPYYGRILASVNVAMLMAQWFGVLLLTLLALFIFKSSNQPNGDSTVPSESTDQGDS